MPQSSLRRPPRALLKRWPLLVLGGGILLGAVVVGTLAARAHDTVLDELAAARPARVLSPRFSIPVGYRPCTVLRRGADETVARESCGAGDGTLARFEALADVGDESADPDTLQASALLAIMGDDRTEASLDTAIARLARELPLAGRQVAFLVDLSGAHLARAQLTQNARDLLQGLQYALDALRSEPRNSAALFNTALALELMGLDDQGSLAWADYLRVDSTSEWAEEARRRRRDLQRRTPLPPEPGPESPEEVVRTYASRYPQEARLLGWNNALGRWGAALETGDTTEAAGWLRLADRLGATLAWRGGDASLADAVGAIRAASDDRAATRVLARAHRRFAAAQTLYQEHDTRDAARDSFARVLAARPHSPTLVRWTEAFRAATGVYDRKFSTAELAYQSLMTRIDSVRYPALAARVRWMRGTGLIRSDKYIEARALYRSSARLFEHAGETEYAAYARAQSGEAAYYQRDTAAAYGAMHGALMDLRKYRTSRWLHNTLLVLRDAAIADEMPLTAEKIRGEDGFVARGLSSTSVKAEALLGFVEIRAVTARRTQAVEDLDSAAAIVARMDVSTPRRILEAYIRSLRVLVATDGASVAALDSAVDYLRREKVTDRLIPALLRRADVRLLRGEVSTATADLDEATAAIHGLGHAEGSAFLRAAMMERTRSRFDQLVMLRVRAGDTVAALRTLERGRVSFAPGSSRAAPAQPRLAAPPGQVAVEYALIGDTLLIWTVRGRDVRLHTETLDRRAFLRMIDRVGAALESPARAESARPDLERLYEQLIRPVKERLGASDRLVILADGEVAGVPFSTLVDARSGHYLVQDHVLRSAATLADAARAAPTVDAAARPLLVANPAFDPLQYAILDGLDNTQVEVDALARMYPGSKRLDGKAAARDSLIRYAPRASLIHYAGHALFDDARPERSALVLAGDTTQKLTAGAVNGLQLRGVRLVVLAACRTLRSREGRSGGFAGFSGALLGAGAGGVVGSLWEVDDSLTTPFMLAFHRAYRESGDPAAALRDAQLGMLRLNDPKLSSPAVWGSFRYIGH